MLKVSRLTPLLDKYAISASAICAVHCICLPLFLGVFPALSTSIFGQERFHQILIWVVVPLSFISLALGCKRHKRKVVALLGLVGITILSSTVVLGHDVLGESGERVATFLGALAIAAAHVRNYVLCRKTRCNR